MGQAGDSTFPTTPFTFTVTQTGETSVASTVYCAVTSTVADEDDFAGGVLQTDQVLPFDEGQVSKPLTINVAGDLRREPDEIFTVTLSNPSAGSVVGTAVAVGVIHNDD